MCVSTKCAKKYYTGIRRRLECMNHKAGQNMNLCLLICVCFVLVRSCLNVYKYEVGKCANKQGAGIRRRLECMNHKAGQA